MTEEDKKKGLTRRDFLKTSGIATGTLLGGGLIGGLIGYNANKEVDTAKKNQGTGVDKSSPKGLKFFQSYNDFEVSSRATERIFPKDDLGPGAIELGVPYFIDEDITHI